eukprot:m.167155 g.167155  ORF g.167155 m.167155 type:complete len:53 (-) comp24082_c2_seq5:646-804(-)
MLSSPASSGLLGVDVGLLVHHGLCAVQVVLVVPVHVDGDGDHPIGPSPIGET